MSHFYANIKGSRGEATRCGTKASGMEGHIRGWDLGVHVTLVNTDSGEDRVAVYLTAGSNGGKDRYLGTFTASDLG